MSARRLRTILAAASATLILGSLVAAAPTPAAGAPPAELSSAGPSSAGPVHRPRTVAFDKYSLIIDGARTFVWSGEMHPYRLPSPDLWRDVLQKMKGSGLNAVSFYFDWAYHSPKQGVYDFTGVRDMDRLLTIAEQVGLYVIARPGPYINAEVDSGGFPAWLATQAGRARTDAPDYLAASDEWLTQIDAIIKKHQITDGGGSVILYQIENELSSAGATQKRYMQHLYDKVRADGIAVPIFHNDKGRNGIWVPTSSQVPGTVVGPTDMYAFDGYPGGSCRTDATPGSPNVAPDWGIYGPGGAKGGASASPNTPGFVAEFGGGWFDYWGSNGTYPCTAVREGPGYERVFYGTNIANGLTLQNFYMTFGGTSWGWLPAPVVYTSYDYGAAISEDRQLRPKAYTLKEMGYFLQSVEEINKIEKGPEVVPSSAAIKVYHPVNPDNGTQFLIAMHNPSNARTNDTFTMPVTVDGRTYTVPQAGTLAVNGQDAKILVAGYDVEGQRLVYSTSELMTHLSQDDHGVLLFYGRNGESGETVLRYPSAPTVKVLAGTVTSAYDPASGDLRLNYTHTGLAQVQITGGGRTPVTLLLADQSTADRFWRLDTSVGPILVRGPELVRTAVDHGNTLDLAGDTDAPTDIELWVPRKLHTINWNRSSSPAYPSGTGSLITKHPVPGPKAVPLPDLSKATWKYTPESPEAKPAFDDGSWRTADLTATNSTTKPPAGQPVLTADDYGFHHGDVWYRGRFGGDAPATVSLTYGGGGAGMVQAWLDGTYLGQNVLPTALASPPTRGTATFTVPDAARTTGEHVLSVMVRNNSHNEDGGVNDAHKEGRGLISAAFADATGTATPPAISWRIQGSRGGEDLADPVRGPLNNGGLYGERAGWYLPGFPDRKWQTRSVPDTTAPAGTSWYRTTFDVRVPNGDDASIGLTIGDPTVPRSGGHYRVLIFLNGWNMGQYVADVGPQHTFVLPTGILNPNGRNTLALAVTSDGGAGDALESVRLTNLATVRGGVPVSLVRSPGWNGCWARPDAQDD